MAVTIRPNGKSDLTSRRPTMGETVAEKSVVAVPDTTASATEIGLIRFTKGFTPVNIQIDADDLSSGTAITADIGYVYDDTTLTSDTNAFIDGSDLLQDGGSDVWPLDDATGIGFVAEADGWLTLTTADAATDTPGNITAVVTYTYDA